MYRKNTFLLDAKRIRFIGQMGIDLCKVWGASPLVSPSKFRTDAAGCTGPGACGVGFTGSEFCRSSEGPDLFRVLRYWLLESLRISVTTGSKGTET